LSSTHGTFLESSGNITGIYFDPIGSLKIVDGHLDVIIPIDISYIQPHIQNLNGVIGSSKFLCKQSALYTDIECLNLHQPLSIRYSDIIRDFESISHLIESRSKRSAWIGGVGSLFKHLFGTMDEDDAIQYSKAIQLVQTDQKNLSKLVKQNILVTTSTLSSLQDTLNKISINEQKLNNAIDNLMLNQQNLSTITDNLLLKTKLNGILNILESSLLTLSFKIEDVINGIMFSKSNILYPSIITPKQLFTELVENYRFLSEYHQFPVSLSLDSIYTLMNISEIATYYNDNKIVFVLKVPLVNPQNYYLYHSIPYPVTVVTNTYTAIIPSTKYVAITKDKNHYCKLDNLISCKIVYKFNYICYDLNTYSSSATPICESEIISKALKSVPSNCETKILKGHLDIWQPLTNNRWIYVISNPHKLSIDCRELNNTEITISDTGILNLPENCIAYYKDLRLIPKYSKIIKFRTIHINFNLINDSCCNAASLLKLKRNVPTLNLSNVNLDYIKTLQYTDTNQIVKDLDKIIEKPHIVLYGEYYSYTTIVIVIIIVIFTFILLYKIIKSGKCPRSLNKNKVVFEMENVDELSQIATHTPKTNSPKIRTSLP